MFCAVGVSVVKVKTVFFFVISGFGATMIRERLRRGLLYSEQFLCLWSGVVRATLGLLQTCSCGRPCPASHVLSETVTVSHYGVAVVIQILPFAQRCAR